MNATSLRSVTPAAPAIDPVDDALVIEWYDQWTGLVDAPGVVRACGYTRSDAAA